MVIKKEWSLITFFLVAVSFYQLFCQEQEATLINNIENMHIHDLGNIGRTLPEGLIRKSYYEYEYILISFVKYNREFASIKEHFETDGKIVTKYSLILTFDEIIPNDVKMIYIEIFDSFFNRFGINPASMKKNVEDNSRYGNIGIRFDDQDIEGTIKLFEIEAGYFSRQIIEVSLRE
jgi:hypothetical protein